jgi:DNA-binding Xre family transcriptional regulator
MPKDRNVDAEIARGVAAVLAVLRRERELRGWSLDELSSRLVHITTDELRQLENGTNALRFLEFLMICSALEIEPEYVLNKVYGENA